VTEAVLLVEPAGRAIVLRLNRPDKLNALSTDLEHRLDEALRSEPVRSAACVVVTGAGERAFSSGADVSEFVGTDPAQIISYYEGLGDVYERMAALPQPTIAAIRGYCLGGGLELALACDFRVADTTATFGLPEVAIGIVPSSGGTVRLTRLVGPGRAKELILLRQRFDAEEALRWGVVTEVVDEGGALDRAVALAEELADLPPLALRVAKLAIDGAADASREAGLTIERLAYGVLSQTEDAKEATQAFLEKRDPRFRGQ